jgi:chromosome partitioning protein
MGARIPEYTLSGILVYQKGGVVKVITVSGFKGGVGKTVSAFSIAAFLARFGRTVLVDGDPNRSAIKWAERGKETGYKLPFETVDQRKAMKVVTGADYLLIDTPARPDSEDLKVLSEGADIMILPCSTDIISLEPTIEMARELGGAVYRILITLCPPYPSRDGELLQADLVEGDVAVFATRIPRTVAFAKAALAGRPISDYDDPRAKVAAESYEAITRELLEVIR